MWPLSATWKLAILSHHLSMGWLTMTVIVFILTWIICIKLRLLVVMIVDFMIDLCCYRAWQLSGANFTQHPSYTVIIISNHFDQSKIQYFGSYCCLLENPVCVKLLFSLIKHPTCKCQIMLYHCSYLLTDICVSSWYSQTVLANQASSL